MASPTTTRPPGDPGGVRLEAPDRAPDALTREIVERLGDAQAVADGS